MPVKKSGNKWKIGSGRAIYKTKAAAQRAYRGYLAQKSNTARQVKRKVSK